MSYSSCGDASDDYDEEVAAIREQAVIKELRRVLRLLYGEQWEDVYEDIMVNFPLDNFDA